jgi:hypothetical protein
LEAEGKLLVGGDVTVSEGGGKAGEKVTVNGTGKGAGGWEGLEEVVREAAARDRGVHPMQVEP